jgi:hypothetical protein
VGVQGDARAFATAFNSGFGCTFWFSLSALRVFWSGDAVTRELLRLQSSKKFLPLSRFELRELACCSACIVLHKVGERVLRLRKFEFF